MCFRSLPLFPIELGAGAGTLNPHPEPEPEPVDAASVLERGEGGGALCLIEFCAGKALLARQICTLAEEEEAEGEDEEETGEAGAAAEKLEVVLIDRTEVRAAHPRLPTSSRDCGSKLHRHGSVRQCAAAAADRSATMRSQTAPAHMVGTTTRRPARSDSGCGTHG